MRVESWDELLASWNSQADADLEIEVGGMIRFPPDQWLGPVASERSLVLRFGPDAGLDFAAVYVDGDRTGRNGLQFRGRRLVIEGGRFVNFNVGGAAIRWDHPDEVVIDGAAFSNIGNICYPPVRSESPQTVITQSLAGYHPGTAVVIRGVRWQNCGFNSHRWSHCAYIYARRIRVRGCEAEDCGQVFELHATEGVTVVGCEIARPKLCYQHGEAPGWPHVWYLMHASPCRFAAIDNRIEGPCGFYARIPDPDLVWFDNEWVGDLQAAGQWGYIRNKYITRDEWISAGMK